MADAWMWFNSERREANENETEETDSRSQLYLTHYLQDRCAGQK